MCYAKPGPRCSPHARARLEKVKSLTPEDKGAILEAQDDYDETKEGQEILQQEIDTASGSEKAELQARLEAAKVRRDDKVARFNALKETKNEVSVPATAKSRAKGAGAGGSMVRDTDPALAIPVPEPIGRLYRMPGSEALPLSTRGNPILPDQATIMKNILDGTYVPSVTNVLGVRNSPHLVGWASKKAAWAMIDELRENPELLNEGTSALVTRAANASDRVRDAAAEQGTLVHLACERYARGLELPDMTPEQQAYFNNFKQFCEDFQPEFVHNEVTAFGKTPQGHGYAGTADAIVKINGTTYSVDYKTTRSGLHTDLAMQLSAGAHAEKLLLDDGVSTVKMPYIQGGFGVHLSPERYRVAQVELDGEVWENFCGLRANWSSHVLGGLMRNGRNVLRPAVNGPEALRPTR